MRGRRLYTDASSPVRASLFIDLNLCSNGAFVDSRTPSVGPGRDNRQLTEQLGDGLWHITGRSGGAVLELRYHAGETHRMTLDLLKQHIGLDGTPVVVGPTTLCR